jgi:AAA+ ATPase superfamily predicted ATPase
MHNIAHNPFDGYGHIVRGNQFIGRGKALRAIQERVVKATEPGNFAIIGDHRIGKSSLAYIAIMEKRGELLQQGRIPIWVNIAKYDNQADFFRSLVTLSYTELDDLDLSNESIDKARNRVVESTSTWAETFEAIQRYFKKVRQSGRWIIFVLDEFDHARVLFKDSISGFQQLRSLSYDDPEGRVTFVTTSRRTIREIEEQTHAISTFDGIFAKEYLGVFDNEDMTEFYEVMGKTELHVTQEMLEQIESYCGGHPYLLTGLGYRMVGDWLNGKIPEIDKLMLELSPSFLNQYDRMTKLLREDGSLIKLLQILFGPALEVTQAEIEDFLRYGLLKVSSSGSYVAFSGHFHSYLRLIERDSDLWPIWKQTEIAIRELISQKMSLKYPHKDWVTELENEKPKLKNHFDRCREAQAKEQRSFGTRASSKLIDFTYPSDLFDIIFSEWNIFYNVLGKDKAYWEERRQLLSRIRNPLAHNREVVLQEYERLLAEAYCKEILSCVSPNL